MLQATDASNEQKTLWKYQFPSAKSKKNANILERFMGAALLLMLPHSSHSTKDTQKKHIHSRQRRRRRRSIFNVPPFKPEKYARNIIFTLSTQNEQIIRINFTLKTFSSVFLLVRVCVCVCANVLVLALLLFRRTFTNTQQWVCLYLFIAVTCFSFGFDKTPLKSLRMEIAFPHFVLYHHQSSFLRLI